MVSFVLRTQAYKEELISVLITFTTFHLKWVHNYYTTLTNIYCVQIYETVFVCVIILTSYAIQNPFLLCTCAVVTGVSGLHFYTCST